MTAIVYTLGQLAERLGAELRGAADRPICGIASLLEAGPEQLTFVTSAQYRKHLPECKAGAVMLKAGDADAFSGDALIVDDPYLAYAELSHLFDRRPASEVGIHPTAVVADDAVIDPTASIGPYVVVEAGARIAANVTVGPHTVIGARCVIGEGSWLAPRVTLFYDVIVGRRAVIQSGAVIGGEGFGFANHNGVWKKIAQVGGVVLGDDVEVGANTTVDRGALADTVLGNGVKLDNQIMIGHNVQVGDNTAMAACVGISGSTRVGKNCMIAGAVGVAGHLDICDNVFVSGMSMITGSITEPGSYSSGTGLQPSGEWRKSVARFRQLDDMARRLRKVEKSLTTVTSDENPSSEA
jgi:UDP-3-O-[3-hydroxymyristoyl] glucosamine N-acyltransferase